MPEWKLSASSNSSKAIPDHQAQVAVLEAEVLLPGEAQVDPVTGGLLTLACTAISHHCSDGEFILSSDTESITTELTLE